VTPPHLLLSAGAVLQARGRAAARRRRPQRTRSYRSISVGRSAANPPDAAAAVDRRDRRTDGRRTVTQTLYRGSVDNTPAASDGFSCVCEFVCLCLLSVRVN